VKHALLADAGLAEWLAANAMAVVGKDTAAIAGLVARAAAVKVAIVDRDPTEQGERALLNLGHTYAHAIEARHDDRIKHGEAVAIGLVAAMTVASRLGRVRHAQVESLQALLERVGLPTRLQDLVPSPDSAATLRRCMELDKKRAGKGLVLVLPEGPVGAGLVEAPPEEAVMAGWSAVGAA
jgi:3-dehydroquinate synthase